MSGKPSIRLTQHLQICLLLISWLLSTVCIAGQNAINRADAGHLLSRTGLGVNLDELNHLTGKSREYAVDYIMDGFSNKPALPMPAWVHQPAPLYWARRDLSREDKQLFDRQRDAEFVGLRQWWVDNMLATDSPQTERMVLFWHNHFATSYHHINRQSKALALQNQTFRTQAMGDFRSLLKSMIRDPALLNYLDNLSNHKTAPNENLARELLELFTMGEGQYTQTTVREAARALTGYGVSQNRNLSFEFKSWNHDREPKTLFGNTGMHRADDLIELILQQPATATHIARKFWHAFISDITPNQEQLTPLAEKFRNSDYDIAVLYRAVLESDEFWDSAYRTTIIKSPAQWFIGTARTLQFPLIANQAIPAMMTTSGMSLFDPPNVAGWPGGMAWITPGRLLNRQASMQNLLHRSATTTAEQQFNMMSKQDMVYMDMPMSPTARSINHNSTFHIHMAAENYRGPAQYRVELRSGDNDILWRSANKLIPAGHETTRLGRVNSLSELPWQVVEFAAPNFALEQAQHLRIHFVNDAGGNDGDRNLFISGAVINKTWYDSARGTQQSKCAPQSRVNAGRLYCNGFIDMAITGQTPEVSPSTPAAASVHVNWVRVRDSQLDLTLTFQDLHTDHNYFPTFSFHLKSRKGELPRLELNSFGCWPDCLSQWPECAWQDPLNESRKTLAFNAHGPGNDNILQCHRNSITDAEYELIRSLFVSAPSLTDTAFSSARELDNSQSLAFDRWRQLLQKHQHSIRASHKEASILRIEPALKRKSPTPQSTVITPAINKPQILERHLLIQNATLLQILLPGIDSQALPELHAITESSLAAQLDAIVSHPIFQLH